MMPSTLEVLTLDFITKPGRIYSLDNSGKLVAEITFPSKDGVANIDHTYVDNSLRGQGIAEKLLKEAIQQIRSQSLKATLTCSYAVKWFAEHPEESDLLDE